MTTTTERMTQAQKDEVRQRIATQKAALAQIEADFLACPEAWDHDAAMERYDEMRPTVDQHVRDVLAHAEEAGVVATRDRFNIEHRMVFEAAHLPQPVEITQFREAGLALFDAFQRFDAAIEDLFGGGFDRWSMGELHVLGWLCRDVRHMVAGVAGSDISPQDAS